MKKILRKRWIWGSLLILLLVMGSVLGILFSPWWLRPHQPLPDAEAVIVEGFLPAETMCEIGEYLKERGSLKVFTTGTNRSSMVWRGKVAGTLHWRFDHANFKWQEGEPIPCIRIKGHGKKCNGEETWWTVAVNGDTLFDGEMPTYQAREFNFQAKPPDFSIREFEIGLHHPNPGPDCRWILWYVFWEGMENVKQELAFQPDDPTSDIRLLPGTTGATAKAKLVDEGMRQDRIEVVKPRETDEMRTFGSALALRHYLENHHPNVRRLNLLTGDLHAQRSWECYQHVFRDTDIEVGVKRFTYQFHPLKEWWTNPDLRGGLIVQLKKYLGWRAWKLVH